MKLNLLCVVLLIGVVYSVSTSEVVSHFETLFKDLPAKLSNEKTMEGMLDDVVEFFKGFGDGIGTMVASDANMFKICYHGFGSIWDEFEELLSFLRKWWNDPKIGTLVESLLEFSGDCIANLLPCYIPFTYLYHVLGMAFDISWKSVRTSVILTLAANAQMFYQSTVELAVCLYQGKPYYAGEQLAKIIYSLIFH